MFNEGMPMNNIIECINLTHYYGKKRVYENLNFSVREGEIFGLLGKNGAGKTTTINILNGHLTPTGGECRIFNENSQKLSPETKRRIGYLMEGHIQYSFMNIQQIEKFYAAFYPRWRKDAFYDLMSKLDVTPRQMISKMSCGQRSQVALGLVLAQDPDLMVMDDYSMGLDPGYRRLFIDYLKAYARDESKTIFVTSHIIQDLEGFIDECLILGHSGILLYGSVENFRKTFRKFQFKISRSDIDLKRDDLITNVEIIKNLITVYSFKGRENLENHLIGLGINCDEFKEIPMSLEDAFIGLTGKY
jgi:ABC-2 type transport system ATP-binding protein